MNKKGTKDLKRILNEREYVIVLFSSDCCKPCQKIKPIYKEFANIYKEILFLEIDVYKYSDVADEYDVNTMPTFALFRKGVNISNIQGANMDKVENSIKECLNII